MTGWTTRRDSRSHMAPGIPSYEYPDRWDRACQRHARSHRSGHYQYLAIFHRLPQKQREKEQNRPFGTRYALFTRIGYIGVYFPKRACKIAVRLMDIFRLASCHFAGRVRLHFPWPLAWLIRTFCSQRKMSNIYPNRLFAMMDRPFK